MTLEPLLMASTATQIHVIAATLSIIGAVIMLLGRKGNARHRLIGRLWVGSMAITALSSFLIHDIRMVGSFSVIHILSVVTLYGLCQIVYYARKRDIRAHKKAVLALVFRGLGIAGVFTFLPGRRLNAVFFGGDSVVGFAFVALVVIFLWLLSRASERKNSHFTS